MNIYFVRHGIAMERDDPRCPPEAQRPLTTEGREKTKAVAKGLRTLGVKPDKIFTSPYARAKQTAEIMAEVLSYDGEIEETDALLPGSAPRDLFAELKRSGAEEIMCFGHAPSIDYLVAHAVGQSRAFTSLKKAGVALAAWRGDSTGGDLLALLTPAILMRL